MEYWVYEIRYGLRVEKKNIVKRETRNPQPVSNPLLHHSIVRLTVFDTASTSTPSLPSMSFQLKGWRM